MAALSKAFPDLRFSASAIRTLESCPREFHFRYVAGTPRQDVPARMVLGTGVHEGLAAFYQALMDGHSAPSESEMTAIAVARMTAELEGKVPVSFDNGQDEEWLAAEAERVLTAFAAAPFLPKKILGVELPFSVALPPAMGGPTELEERLVGVFDLVVEDEDGTIIVVDHKVTARLAPPKRSTLDAQALLYLLAARGLWGEDKVIEFAHHALVRGARGVRCGLHRIPRSAEDLAEAQEMFVSAAALVDAALASGDARLVFGRRRSWRCGSCGYRRTCAEKSQGL